MTIAGIRRGNQFSPNHIGNDAAIFSLTAEHLGKLGCKTLREIRLQSQRIHRIRFIIV